MALPLRSSIFPSSHGLTLFALVTAILTLLSATPSARAFTAADAYNLAFNFNYNFYNKSGGCYLGKTGGSFDQHDFWENAEMIEMAVDVADRTGYASDEMVVSNLVAGFDRIYGSDWTCDIAGPAQPPSSP
ncbi:MAG TPA: hypothetical protein VGY56_05345 [Verrucomicrobiae bacterium]|nr:hypothetical protein [Verrucomicrobiae bacterium]